MKREVNIRTLNQNEAEKGLNDKKVPLSQEKKKTKSNSKIISDPLGSWTGVPTDPFFDMPIQDADDL